MPDEIKAIPLEPLGIYGLMGTTLIPLAVYNLKPEENRADVIQEILSELVSKDIVIMFNTAIKTEAFDGFRII